MKTALKRNWTGFVAGAKAQYPGRDSNLKCKYIEGDFEDQNTLPFLLPVRNYVQSHRFADAAVTIDSYIAQRISTSTGRPLFSIAVRELEQSFGDNIETNEELLKSYQHWYETRTDCPYAATAYAWGLQATGHSHRGTNWGHKVKAHQWEAMEAYNQKAQAVYEKTRAHFQNHWYWSKKYLHFALTSDVGKEEIWRRFKNAVAANPYDNNVYENMAYMMLPRWHGSAEDIEKVASYAADVTQEHYGDMMYARTFASIYEYHNLTELWFDGAKLKKGFQDWIDLFPSDYVKTYYACTTYCMGEFALTLEILESLDEFYIEAWDANEDIYLANSICREFSKQTKET